MARETRTTTVVEGKSSVEEERPGRRRGARIQHRRRGSDGSNAESSSILLQGS
jgi:hypothetical protein